MIKQKSFFLLLVVFFQTLFSQEEIPVLTEFVTDKAKVLSDDESSALKEKLKKYEIATTHQLVVCIIEELPNTTIELHANEIFEKNKIGEKQKDNGVLLLVSIKDRKLRIEVGYGLESILTDAKCSRIIREIIIPEFKQQKYYKGINSGVDKIISVINDPLSYEGEVVNKRKVEPEISPTTIIIILSIFFGPMILGMLFFLIKYLFIPAFNQMVHLYRGLLFGKIGVFHFLIIFVSKFFGILIPLIFMSLFIALPSLGFINHGFFEWLVMSYEEFSEYYFFFGCYVFPALLLVVIPVLFALLKRKQVTGLPIKLSLRTDMYFKKKYLPSSGFSFSSSSSSSYSSSGSSYSSSSSSGGFSGGGGSSGGGGASGSW